MSMMNILMGNVESIDTASGVRNKIYHYQFHKHPPAPNDRCIKDCVCVYLIIIEPPRAP